MEKFSLLALFSVLAVAAAPAHAGPLGVISDVIQLGQNVINGTIPLPYVLAFGGLVLAIIVLGVFEARKNARKAAQESSESASAPVRLDK